MQSGKRPRVGGSPEREPEPGGGAYGFGGAVAAAGPSGALASGPGSGAGPSGAGPSGPSRGTPASALVPREAAALAEACALAERGGGAGSAYSSAQSSLGLASHASSSSPPALPNPRPTAAWLDLAASSTAPQSLPPGYAGRHSSESLRALVHIRIPAVDP